MTGGVPVNNEIELRFQHDSTSLNINMQRFKQKFQTKICEPKVYAFPKIPV